MTRRGFVALSAVVSIVGCDIAAPESYRGEPIFVLDGPIFTSSTPEADLAARRGRLRLALLWTGPGLAETVEYPTFGHAPDAPRYVVPLFDTAPLAGPWAIGRLLSYIDHDGDGRYGPGDEDEVCHTSSSI